MSSYHAAAKKTLDDWMARLDAARAAGDIDECLRMRREDAQAHGLSVADACEAELCWHAGHGHGSAAAGVPSGTPTVLTEGEALVCGDRDLQYGHPRHNLAKVAAIWEAILGETITPKQVALCMVGVKLAREAHAPKRDNIVDAAGYLRVYERLDEQEGAGFDGPACRGLENIIGAYVESLAETPKQVVYDCVSCDCGTRVGHMSEALPNGFGDTCCGGC